MKKTLITLILCFIYTHSFAYGIKGRLLDERRFPVPNVSINVTGGSGSKTDKNGVFKFNVEKLPYDLYLSDGANAIAVYYKNISSLEPEVTFFGLSSSRYVNTEVLKVDFLPVPANSTLIIKFVSSDAFYSEDIIASPGEKSKVLMVDWPSASESITGRVIFLQKTSLKYEKFGERAVTIQKGFYPQTISFDTLSFYNTPGESYITLYLPSMNYETKGFSVYADFLSLHKNAEILLNTTEGDIISTKVLVPQSLPFGFRLKVSARGFLKGGSGFENYIYTYPGSVYNLTSETPPQLDAPQDKYWNVNTNTIFGYDMGSGIGIYVVHFHSFEPVGDFYYITNERQVSSPLSAYSGILKGDEFSWDVSKYLSYISVDDFVKEKKFSNDLGYKAVLRSETRTFRTKPF